MWWKAPLLCVKSSVRPTVFRKCRFLNLLIFEPLLIRELFELFEQIQSSTDVNVTHRKPRNNSREAVLMRRLECRVHSCFLYTGMFTFHLTLGHFKRQSVLFSVEHKQLVCRMLTAFSSTFMTLRVGIRYLYFVRHTVICIDRYLNSASYWRMFILSLQVFKVFLEASSSL